VGDTEDEPIIPKKLSDFRLGNHPLIEGKSAFSMQRAFELLLGIVKVRVV